MNDLVTITQVATHAGVSMKTVSRVLNNEAHVRPALRERVLRAAAELNYRPNLAARQLAGNRSFLISFVILETMNSYFSKMVVEAAAECRRHNYHLVSESFAIGEQGDQVVARITATLRPDGIILAPPLSDDDGIVAAVERTGTPLVRLAGSGPARGEVVEMHERAISCAVVEHLLGLGHRRIGMIAPPDDHRAAQQRVAGYREALQAAAVAYDPAIVIGGDFSFASGARAASMLLARPDRPTALFAANDGMALGAMAIARKIGLAVPHDVAIAGFDDSPGSRMVYPALTTVRQPLAAMARNAVLTLLGRQPEYPIVHELLRRGSTTGLNDLILTELDA